MAASLRDIPGANPTRKRRFRPERRRPVFGPPRRARARFARLNLTHGFKSRRRRQPRLNPGPGIDKGLVLLWLFFAALIVVGARLGWQATRVDVEVSGIEDGVALTVAEADDMTVEIDFDDQDDLSRATLTFDERDVLDEVEIDGLTMRWRPEPIAEGDHELRLAVPRLLLGDSVFTFRLAVDSTAPVIDVPALEAGPIDESVTVRGTVEAGVTLRHLDEPVPVDDDGRFAIDFDAPPTEPVLLVAVDRAGNTSTAEVVVPVAYPEVRGVHVSAAAWADDDLRSGVLALADARLIDTVVLDLKDEDGVIGWDARVPRARQIGAVRPRFDLAAAVQELHERGLRVMGRMVAFRDPVLAEAAWAEGAFDQVVQTPAGAPLPAYGGFTNYAHPAVRAYNIDIALDAVGAGVDDIVWDYARRPDGNPEDMVVPGLARPSTEEVADFLRQGQELLRAEGAYQGASVFGIAASRGDAIGQDVGSIARHTDFLAPMIYPSHWVPGEYRVPNPIEQPFEITEAVLADFQRAATGTGVAMAPWIQDFTLHGVEYGPDQVRAQLDAARSLGIGSFLLWNAEVRYQGTALDPIG